MRGQRRVMERRSRRVAMDEIHAESSVGRGAGPLTGEEQEQGGEDEDPWRPVACASVSWTGIR